MNLESVATKWRSCVRCPLNHGRTQVVHGRWFGRQAPGSMLVVGDAPGDQEDDSGAAFMGPDGISLDKALSDAGVTSAYIVHAVGCKTTARHPSPDELEKCAPRLKDVAAEVVPTSILSIGRSGGKAAALLAADAPSLKALPKARLTSVSTSSEDVEKVRALLSSLPDEVVVVPPGQVHAGWLTYPGKPRVPLFVDATSAKIAG